MKRTEGRISINSMEDFDLKITPSEKVFTTPFAEQFVFNIEQLNYRMRRLAGINSTDASMQSEYLMVFDSAIVLFRSLFLESGKKNYTFQNYYRLNGRPDVADAIDAYLDSEIDTWSKLTIRAVLKTIADKYVCHLDSIDYTELALANSYMARMSSEEEPNNFQNIVSRINTIIKETRESNKV